MGYFADRWRECRACDSPKDLFVTPLCVISARISAATLLNLNRSKRGYSLECYALVWLISLWLMLTTDSVSGVGRFLILALGVYRLQDLVFASLDNVFGLTMRGEDWERLPPATPVLINLLNIVQVIVIFALFYRNWPDAGHDGFSGDQLNALPGKLGFGFLYMSWTTLFPPGSGFTPIHTATRWLIMTESVTGLLIIGLTLAALLSRDDNSTQEARLPANTPTPTNGVRIREIRDIAFIIACLLVAAAVTGFAGGVLAGMLFSG